jgi:hypothetical protein
MHDRYYERKKEAAQLVYSAQPLIHSPFFNQDIVLNSEGFRHLSRSARGKRRKEEQIRRFILLPLGVHVLKTATTLQGYRKRLVPVGTLNRRRGPNRRKRVQWWAFVALFVDQDIKVRVIVRRVGGGKLHFWSIMIYDRHERRVAPNSASGNK